MNKNIENFVKEIRKYTKKRKKDPNRYKKKQKEAIRYQKSKEMNQNIDMLNTGQLAYR